MKSTPKGRSHNGLSSLWFVEETPTQGCLGYVSRGLGFQPGYMKPTPKGRSHNALRWFWFVEYTQAGMPRLRES